MVLYPHQATVLAELHDYGRSLAALRVSAGKTLISFLAARVLDASRPLLLVPAKLVDKTRREFELLERHFQGVWPEILSYEKLGTEKWSQYLESFVPDLIIADEAHKLRNLRASRTRRVRRFLEDHSCVFLPMSGTLARRSVADYAHLSEWALGELSPVPREWSELSQWRRALDVVVPPGERLAPGCLSELAANDNNLDAVRIAYAARRNSTPGWISVESSGVDCSLVLSGERYDAFPKHVDDKFTALRASYETPDGLTFEEPTKLHAYLKQCSTGFWYRFDPPPPPDWREARRAWGSFVRATLAHNRQHLDSELQVARACAAGKLQDYGVYRAWTAVRPQYEPNKHRKTEWFDDSVLRWCHQWLQDTNGILFTPFVAIGERMSELYGYPYFAGRGLDRRVGSIETFPGGPCVASIEANREGRNLQDRWHQALVVGGLTDSSAAEQLLGRLHRTGQTADEVEFTFLYGCVEILEGLWSARHEAKFSDDPEHKLLIGDCAWHFLQEVDNWHGPRWQK